MSWIQKLQETYERCADSVEPVGPRLWPISHIMKQAHVEVVIDLNGNLRRDRIRKLDFSESLTLIPTTENSASRAGSGAATASSGESGVTSTAVRFFSISAVSAAL